MRRRKTNNIYILHIFLCLLLVLSSCSSKRNIAGSRENDVQSAMIVAQSPSLKSARNCLSANLRLKADVAGKSLSAGGTIRIKENEGVQIGVTALGLVEVACLEFLPSSVRLINKIGKEYAEVPYATVAFLQKTGIDYMLLESVLLNRMFSPDGRSVAEAINEMDIVDTGSTIAVTAPEYRGLVYKFIIDKGTSNLVRSEGVYGGGARVVCSYSDFTDVDGTPFPGTVSLSLSGTGKNVTLEFKLSKISSKGFSFSPRRISSGYEKMETMDFLKSLDGKL
jgi:hypothetical protein